MGGLVAVENGQNFERKVSSVLRAAGIEFMMDIPYVSIINLQDAYSYKARMEFKAKNITFDFEAINSLGKTVKKIRKFDSLNIECKFQSTSGSVDEKFSMIFLNSLISDADSTLFLYESKNDAIKKASLEYIKTIARHSNGRLIVKSFSEFQRLIFNENVNKPSCKLSPQFKSQSEFTKKVNELYDGGEKEYKLFKKNSKKKFKKMMNEDRDFQGTYKFYIDKKLLLSKLVHLFGANFLKESNAERTFHDMLMYRSFLDEMLSTC